MTIQDGIILKTAPVMTSIHDLRHTRDIDLSGYRADDVITKDALSRLLNRSGRTVQRMIARRELPPPTLVSGHNVWNAGALALWLAGTAERVRAAWKAEDRRLWRQVFAGNQLRY